MTVRLLIEGGMPYRALNRLRREGICLKNAKKCKKKKFVCVVDEKEVEKVFAIYPNMCYNDDRYVTYRVCVLPARGWQKWWILLKKRVGLWLGGLLFILLTVWSNGYVLKIDVVGDAGYEAAVTELLHKNGVALFRRYEKNSVDVMTAEILRLNGVSFCSIQKIGCTLVVEIHTSPFQGE